MFRVALESPEPPFVLLHLHGPPGIGKTSLLDVYAGLAADAGATVVRLDGRDLLPSPPAVLEVLGEVLEVPDGEGAIAGPPDGGRLVVLFDTYERLAPLDDWVRTLLLPRLPATAVTVVAGRGAAGFGLARRPGVARAVAGGVAAQPEPGGQPPVPARLWRRTGPSRSADRAGARPPAGTVAVGRCGRSRRRSAADPLTPDLVGTLLRRFVEIVPSGLHRRALEVCAIARVTTEGLLREVLGVEDAHEPFSWLRGLSFVESGPEGVFPHDLARDALEADLRWRDPDGYRRVFRADPRPHQRSTADVARTRSNSGRSPTPSTCSADFPAWRRRSTGTSGVSSIPSRQRPSDREAILDLVLAARGRRRRRSRRDGGSSNPRASSWSAATTGRSAASSPCWT